MAEFLTTRRFAKLLERINVREGEKVFKRPFATATFLYKNFFYSGEKINGHRAFPKVDKESVAINCESLSRLANKAKLTKDPKNLTKKSERDLPTYSELRKSLINHQILFLTDTNRTLAGKVLEEYFQKEADLQNTQHLIDASIKKQKKYIDGEIDKVDDKVAKVDDKVAKVDDKSESLRKRIEVLEEENEKAKEERQYLMTKMAEFALALENLDPFTKDNMRKERDTFMQNLYSSGIQIQQ